MSGLNKNVEKTISRFLLIKRILNILIIITAIFVIHAIYRAKTPQENIVFLIVLFIVQGLNYITRPNISYGDDINNDRYHKFQETIGNSTCDKIWCSFDCYKAEDSTLQVTTPNFIKTNITCYELEAKKLKLRTYFLPDKLVIISRTKAIILDYADITFASGHTTGSTYTADAQIYSKQWEHQNKDGSPDRRYKSNNLITTYIYGTVSVGYSGQDLFHIVFSDINTAGKLISGLKKLGFTVQ